MRRIVIPTNDDRGLDSRLSEHFGRAPCFTVVELGDDGNIIGISSISNTSEHFGGFGGPPDALLHLRPDAIITVGMGPRALDIFQRAGVAVFMANSNMVRDIVEAYKEDRLQELTEGCHQARHR